MIINSFDRYDIVNNPGEDKPAFTIWFAGCTVGCKGCYNPKLWSKNNGTQYSAHDIIDIIESQPIEYSSVILLGGEPLEQDGEKLLFLCRMLKRRGYNIWLYTSREFNDISDDILDNIYVAKTGKFDIDAMIDGGVLSSSNQRLYIKQNNIWGYAHENQHDTKAGI